MDYYDAVLGLIPLTVAGIAGALFGLGVDLSIGVPVGTVGVIPLIAHAMFVRVPGQRHTGATTADVQSDQPRQTQARQTNTAD